MAVLTDWTRPWYLNSIFNLNLSLDMTKDHLILGFDLMNMLNFGYDSSTKCTSLFLGVPMWNFVTETPEVCPWVKE